MNRTLFRYIFFMQFKSMLFVAFLVFGLIYLFDFIEVMRKFPISDFFSLITILKFAFLKSPLTFCEVMHYVYFITATFNLWSLCNSQQLTVMKSSGKSPTQILFPFVSFAFLSALSWLFILHPLSIYSDAKYKKYASSQEIINQNKNIWIDYSARNKLIYIGEIKNNKLFDITIFSINTGEKIVAAFAEIENDKWIFENISTINQGRVQHRLKIKARNFLSKDLIQLLSNIPKKSDIYSLYKIYIVQHKSGTELREYALEFHKLIANCATFILFALIAAMICFPINRYRSKTNITIQVIFYSIFIKFANNICNMLALNGILSVSLASWGIILILSLLSVSVLVWKEL